MPSEQEEFEFRARAEKEAESRRRTPQEMSKEYTGTLLPFRIDAEGKRHLAVPGAIQSAYQAITAPGRAFQSAQGDYVEPDKGGFNPQEEAGNVALNMIPAYARGRAVGLAPATSPVADSLKTARGSGYRISPAEAEAGPVSRTLESLSGEAKTAKLASHKNQAITNEKIAKDVGLPEDIPVTRESLAKIRAEEGANYNVIKGTGEVITSDEYRAALKEIGSSFDTAAKDFPHRKVSPIKETLDGLNRDSFDASSAVEEVKLLRADADKAYASGDKQLGKAYKAAASALDDEISRHVQQIGNPQLAKKYFDARTRIAKTYMAEKALNEATGNINPDVYAKAYSKGQPLSGESREVGQVAAAFPKSMRRSEKRGSTGPTIFDIGMATLGKEAILLGLRPGGRSLVTSKMYQDAFVSTGPGLGVKLSDIARKGGGKYGFAVVPQLGLRVPESEREE